MKIEALTIRETESETPNAGTVIWGDYSQEVVRNKIKDAIESHMDADVISMSDIDWIGLRGYDGIGITASISQDGTEHGTWRFEIEPTVIY